MCRWIDCRTFNVERTRNGKNANCFFVIVSYRYFEFKKSLFIVIYTLKIVSFR